MDPVATEPGDLSAWSLVGEGVDPATLDARWPHPVTREWAWGGSTGRGTTVCLIDSGIERDHPRVGRVARSVSVRLRGGDPVVEEGDEEGDVNGHGTACAGIVRAMAPDCELVSVRVLGDEATGTGLILLAGLGWAIEQRFPVVNLSLSTRREDLAAALYRLADRAYFRRGALVVSAHNRFVESFPWRFSSVLSVASHERPNPFCFFYNPSPPVEFFARGVDVDVAWALGRSARVTGNSFAAPHIAALCALVLAKHPHLTPFQLKSILYLTADNISAPSGHDEAR